MKYELARPECLEIICPDGETVYGGSQDWYPGRWERASGCGPTAASNLIWYLARSRPNLYMLCDTGCGDKGCFVKLMREMYVLMPPGIGGVNKAAIFTDGIMRYNTAHNSSLAPNVLEIPKKPQLRPDIGVVNDYIQNALQADAPVGFLNLASGTVRELESWHWVTIIGHDTDITETTIIDKGRKINIRLDEWLKSSRLGGAMVYLT